MSNERNHQSTNPNPRENVEHGWLRFDHVGSFPFVPEVPENTNINVSTKLSELPQNTTYTIHKTMTRHGGVGSVSTPYDSK